MIVYKNKNRVLKYISFLYSCAMLFYSMVPPMAVAIFSLLFYFYAYNKLRNEYSTVDRIVLLSIIAIPSSMVSIIGTSYSSLPLTWFNGLVILAVFVIGLKGKISKKYFLYTLFFLLAGSFFVLRTVNIFNATKQFLIIVLFYMSFFVAEYVKKYSYFTLYDDAKDFYLIGVFSLAFQVFLQKVFISSTGIVVGHYAVMGGNRTAYAGLLGDYSFATIYLASGCLFVLLMFLHSKEMSLARVVLMEFVLLLAMILVSARTGLAALIVTVMLYFCNRMCHLKKRHIIVLGACIIILPIIIDKLMSMRTGQSFLDSSGRFDGYIAALSLWKEKPLLGYGLGLDNLKKATDLGAPHNFIIQYLLQVGALGLILISFPIFIYVYDHLRSASYTKWLFILVFWGSMLVPDILSSRFLYGIIIMCSSQNSFLYSKNLGRGVEYET